LRTGKTAKQIEELKQQLDEGKAILVVGLKSSGDYLSRLGEGYVAEESFSSVFGAEKVRTGYLFKKK
jgi:hypothetical protein